MGPHLFLIKSNNDTLKIQVSRKLTLWRQRTNRTCTEMYICGVIFIFYFPKVRSQTV